MASTDYDWFAFNEDASAWHAAKQKEKEADEQCIDEDEVWVIACESKWRVYESLHSWND